GPPVMASDGRRACPVASSRLPAAPERVGGLVAGTRAIGRGDRGVPALRASGAPLPHERASSLPDPPTTDPVRPYAEQVGRRQASFQIVCVWTSLLFPEPGASEDQEAGRGRPAGISGLTVIGDGRKS